MKITSILEPQAICLDLALTSKKQILEEISRKASVSASCDQQEVFDALVERERLGTTGIGKGVAIPHARLAGLDKLYCTMFRVSSTDFEAVDGKPVDLIFCLLVPEDAGADHLKALARISKILRDEDICTSLRNSKTSLDAWNIIARAEED